MQQKFNTENTAFIVSTTRPQKNRETAPETVGVVMRMLLPTPFKLSALVAAIFDRCSTNYAAYDILVGVAPSSAKIGCMTHTLVKPAAKAELPLVKSLVEALTACGHSHHAWALFSDVYGEGIKRHSNVRFHCEFEQAAQQAHNFPCLKRFVHACEAAGYVPETTKAISKLLQASDSLRLQLAVNLDAKKIFVEKTYTLEGDGILVFLVADDIHELTAHVAACRAGVLPNTRALARELFTAGFPHLLQAQQDRKVEALVREQLKNVEPCFECFDA
jgi:hypothetical protein